MSGTREGARKARDKNLKNNPNFYADIGSRSWDNPDRNRKTGFALIEPEARSELGRIGGKKTKNDYHTKKQGTGYPVSLDQTTEHKEEDYVTAEEIHAILEQTEEDGPSASQ